MSEPEGLHVLLVEDNPEERWLMTELLRSRGHSVTACEDAETGWDAFQKDHPSLLLLDWILPGTNGLELCRRIRAETDQDPPCNIVVVTSKGTAADLKAVLDAGADDYIAKPIDVSLLEIRLAVAEERVRRARDAAATKADLEVKTRELEALFQNLDEVFFSVDPELKKLIQVSPAVERLLGLDPAALMAGRGHWQDYLCPPEFRDGSGLPWQGNQDEAVESEYEVSRPDGEARWVRCALKPGRTSDGKLVRVDGLLFDITRRKEIEEKLSERNRELTTLFRISEITQGGTDPQTAVPEILREVASATAFPIVLLERLDRERDSLVVTAAVGTELSADLMPEVPVHQSLAGRVVETGRPTGAADLRTSHRDKSDLAHKLRLRSFLAFPLGKASEVRGALLLADTVEHEISDRLVRWGENLATTLASFLERNEAEEALRLGEQEAVNLAEELQRANEELEAFAYSVSHDLRAPLRTMQGFAHALLQEHGGSLPEQARDFARRIIESGRQSELLIRDLLSYSRMSFEELQLQDVELTQVLADAREQVGMYLEESEAQVEVAEDLPRVLAHHTTLVQVLANLLSNAVKFVPEGTRPRVEVGWEAVKGQPRVRVWVQDNGIGVPDDQRERIFKVFERLEGEVLRPGTGIGLAIVRRGMERVGGKVGVEPGPEGGSRFWLELPLSQQSPRGLWRGSR